MNLVPFLQQIHKDIPHRLYWIVLNGNIKQLDFNLIKNTEHLHDFGVNREFLAELQNANHKILIEIYLRTYVNQKH